MKLSDSIARAITLSTAIYGRRPKPTEESSEEIRFICAADIPQKEPPPEHHELKAFLNGLPAATIYMMTVIMYLGRGEGEVDVHNLLGEYEEISDKFKKLGSAVFQMMSKSVLAEYLEKGLALLSESGLDVDRLLE